MDNRNITASDYTVMIKNFPNIGDDIDEEIKKWAEAKSLPTQEEPVKIVKVNVAYELSEYTKLNK